MSALSKYIFYEVWRFRFSKSRIFCRAYRITLSCGFFVKLFSDSHGIDVIYAMKLCSYDFNVPIVIALIHTREN